MTAAAKANPVSAAIKAAMSVAKDIAEGRLSPAELDAATVEECRRMYGAPAYPGDPLWGLQGEKCRQHLAAVGVPADELSEWLAVARARESSTERAKEALE